MERKRKKNNGVFYIAICTCAVIIAAVGFAGRISMVEEKETELVKSESTPKPMVATPEPVRTESDEVEVNKNVVVEEPLHFNLPVEGKVIAEFSGDDLVYNETLKDWRAHSGVDFSAKLGETVKASADGTIEDIFDSELGRCVIIDHGDGFATMYANLSEETTYNIGDKIKKGDKVGTIGNTALGDSTSGEHLHFEIIKDGKNVNPVDFLD